MNKNINTKLRKIISMILVLTCTTSLVACNNNNDIGVSDSEKKIENSENINDNKDETATAEKSGSIITLGNKAFDIFYGNEEVAKNYSKVISNFKKGLGDDVNVYNMVVPTSVEFGLPEKYKHMSNSQKSAIDNIYDNMSKDIKTIDAYDNLNKHKEEYIYFNTDHHWTSLGAYYAYEEFAKVAGIEAIDIKSYEKYIKEDFLGTFYTQTQDKNLRESPDTVEYYKIPENYTVYRYEKENLDKPVKSTLYADYAQGVNLYSLFLHGDFPMIEIKNKNKKLDKKIVVVKESYGNAFVPFLIPHYEEVIVVDARYYNKDLKNIIENKNVDNVLFINNVFATNTKSIVNKIENLSK